MKEDVPTTLEEKMWFQQLIMYVREHYMHVIGDQPEDWQAFLKNYSYWSIWKDAYKMGTTPGSAWEDEMSYWGE